jgi:signal transduction histidine kinase/CheY-like chemotaxis protein
MKASIFANIINENTKVVNKFIFARFNNQSVEQEYQTSSDLINTYLRHALNIIIFLYYLGFLILSSLYKLEMGIIISSVFCGVQILAVITYYIIKRERVKHIFRYLIAFMFSIFHVCMLWYIAYVLKDVINTNKLFIRLVFFSGLIYFAYLDNSLIIYLFIMGINIGIYVQIYYTDKLFDNSNSYDDFIIMFCFNIGIYMLKYNTDIIARTYLLNKHEMENVYKYLEDLINSFNGYHVYFNKDEIISVNNNFKTYLSSQSERSSAKTLLTVGGENTILIHNDEASDTALFKSAYVFLNHLKATERANGITEGEPLVDVIKRIQDDSGYRNNLFELLGHFNNKKYYEVHFRKTNRLNDILELLIYDITDIKIAEIAKTENKIKHECLAKIAHEFKTPINSVIGLTNQLKESVERGNYFNISNQIQQIQSLSNFTLFLINDIIHYTSINFLNKISIKVEKTNITETLEFCKNVLDALVNCNEAKRRNVKTNLDIDNRIKHLYAMTDELRLRQILLNLISNSVKFTKNGHISLSAKVLDSENLVITLKDTGMGMKEEILAAIRDRRETTSRDRESNKMGTGLGLTICSSLAERMGHQLIFKSIYGIGSTISIIVPFRREFVSKKFSCQDVRRYRPEAIGGRKSFNECEDNGRRMFLNLYDTETLDDSRETVKVEFVPTFRHILRDDEGDHMCKEAEVGQPSLPKVLIVDDNQHMRSTLRQLLGQIFKDFDKEYTIIEGSDGVDILKYVIDDQAEGSRIQCVITDESMEYLDGSFAISILRSLQRDSKIRDVKVITMTSYEDEVTKGSILKAGANYCVSKPCKKNDMVDILKAIKVI